MLADEMGFTITDKQCKRCGSHLYSKGEWVGCWNCMVDNETARRGRALLDKVKGDSNEKE